MKRLAEQSLDNSISKNSVLTEMAVGLETVKTISGGDVCVTLDEFKHRSNTNVMTDFVSGSFKFFVYGSSRFAACRGA